MVNGEATTGYRALNPSSVSASSFPPSSLCSSSEDSQLGRTTLVAVDRDTVDATERWSALVTRGSVKGAQIFELWLFVPW